MTDTPGNVIEIRDCRLRLGRSGSDWVTFHLAELDVAPGERLALTGPSGCGKSTLLNLISGLLRPDAGEMRVMGHNVARMRGGRMDRFRGQHIGFIYQSFNLLDGFSALENVLVGMRFGRAVARGARRARAKELLERVGLEHRLHTRPTRLSVGERQRVAVARAVANQPSILLADEPTGALDPATASEVFSLILEICALEQCALLFVTHDAQLAQQLPRRVDCRRLVSQGAPGEAAP